MLRVVALASAVLACALAASAAAVGAGRAAFPPLTLDGVGGVVPGTTPKQVAGRWGIPTRLGPATGGLTCRTAPIRSGGVRGYALFERGRLGALFFDRGVRTRRGVAIGSTVKALRRAYPRLSVRPDKYVRGGRNYFLTRARPPHWQLRFDTSARGRVTQIGFGAKSAVQLVEGCS